MRKVYRQVGVSRSAITELYCSLYCPCTRQSVGMYPTADLLAAKRPVLITDQLQAPADFLLFRTVTTHLKETKQNRCIILSTFNDTPRWKTIASKSVSFFPLASGHARFSS